MNALALYALAMTVAAVGGRSVLAQSSSTTPSAATPAALAEEIRASGRFVAPLIPEGGFLVAAKGKIGFDSSRGLWTFELADRVAGADRRSIALVPSPSLSDMVSGLPDGGAAGAPDRAFELTALILAYEGSNYLLPNFANPIRREQALEPPVAPPPPGSLAARAAVAESALARTTEESIAPPPINPEDFAAELERRLDTRVSTVPESPVPPTYGVAALPNPATIMPEIEPSASASPTADAAEPRVRLHRRRGALTRDTITGTWRLILASGQRDEGDTALEILPCSQLSALVKQARLKPNSAVLITGDVESYQGRSYLRPTRFEPLRAGKGIGH